MKKLVITILAIFYLGVSSGATLHFHHCMGELVEWGFSDNSLDDSGKCTSCGMEQGNSVQCCKSEKQELNLKESCKAPLNIFQVQTFTLEPQTFVNLSIETITNVNQQDLNQLFVPRSVKTPTFLRNCNFRI